MTIVQVPFEVKVAPLGMNCSHWLHDGQHDSKWMLVHPGSDF